MGSSFIDISSIFAFEKLKIIFDYMGFGIYLVKDDLIFIALIFLLGIAMICLKIKPRTRKKIIKFFCDIID